MLSNKRIKEAIENKQIEISVSFIKNDDSIISLNKEENILKSDFKNNIYSDRVKLTLGPVIKVLNKSFISSKYRFKNNTDCFDMQKANNKYVLKPGESVVVLTNEHIKLNNKYACLVIPRISLSDVGIIVTPAYIDPYYDGILRLQLSNLSDNSYELNTLETIAQCYFFELTDPVVEKFKDDFPKKSVFYGQTWQGIYNSDRCPFPTKKSTKSDSLLNNLKYQINIIWAFIKKHSIIFLLLTNIITILGGYTLFMQNYNTYTTITNQIASFFYPKASEIVINTGETYAEKEIFVDFGKTEIISVLCNNDDITYEIYSGNTADESKIIFTYCQPFKQTEQKTVEFTYIIIRRIEQ